MGVFQRIGDIISANLNDLTEDFENPDQMLKQAIREMEESIGSATLETAKALANAKVLRRELDNNRASAERWQERAAQAVTAGDDELARKALRRKREHDKLIAALEDQLASAADASQSLRRQLEGMKAKLAEARRNLATLSARQSAANFRKKMATVGAEHHFEFNQDAFAKFERFRSRVEQAEAEAEALAELRGGQAVDDVLDGDEQSCDAEISAELEELKSRRR
jgi:phage shock protein A